MEDKPEKDKEEERYRIMAARSYEERMTRLEELRKEAFKEYLLPDGTWPPLKRVLTIVKATYIK